MLATFGIASALVSLAGFIPYIISILKGKTKPQRASWWIWSVLMVIAFLAQVQEGASWSLTLTATYIVANFIIAFLSLRYGYGRFDSKDAVSLFITIASVLLWVRTNNPALALLIIIAVDMLGNWLTYQKTWRAPKSESLLAWVLITFGAVFGLLAVGNLNTDKAVFPAYAVIFNAMIPAIIIYRRKVRFSKPKK